MEKQELKAITEIKAGKLIAIASTETEDRAGDSLKVKDWDFVNFMKNPVLQAGHDYRPQYTIGVAKNIRVDGRKVIFEPIFHEITPLAKQIKQMYEEGILRAWSVGFIPADGNKRPKHELLEVSAVAVPANQEALMVEMKSMDKSQEHEIESKLKEFVESNIEERDIDNDENEAPNEEDVHTEEESDVIEETPVSEAPETEEKDFSPWNPQLPSVFAKQFDVREVKPAGLTFENDVFTKFFNCEIKEVFTNTFHVPSPLVGTYLTAVSRIFENYDLIDTRNWSYSGVENPPVYEVIQLTAQESQEFLVEGTMFYKMKGQNSLAVQILPSWSGLMVTLISHNDKREWNKEMLSKVKTWAEENNWLRGQKFALSGKFIQDSARSFDDIVLSKDKIETIKHSLKVVDDGAKSRGLLFYGPPGTGKTMTGKALLSHDSTFIWVSSKDMDRIGAVSALRLAFELSRNLSPTILFIEDVDKWIGGYATDLLKTELDGIQENKGLLTILTSNYPENLPDALLDRPGRFHEVIKFDLPDEETRAQMLFKWANGINEEKALEVAIKTEGYSGAHIKELIDYSFMIMEDENLSISEAIDKGLDKLNSQKELITTIRQSKKGFGTIEMKEGRVISKGNRKKLEVARDAISEVLEIDSTSRQMEDEVSQEDKELRKAIENEIAKEAHITGDDIDEVLVKALQHIVSVSNRTLHARKKQVKK
ncbi:MAG: AAA family ATPase [Bacteriovoracaceae bacterium]